MVSKRMASSMLANILHVMRLRQAVSMNTSVINSAPQPQHLVIRASCQGCKWTQDHPLPSPPTVSSVSNEAIFSFYHGEIGKIEVLRKAAPCTSFLWWYLWLYSMEADHELYYKDSMQYVYCIYSRRQVSGTVNWPGTTLITFDMEVICVIFDCNFVV